MKKQKKKITAVIAWALSLFLTGCGKYFSDENCTNEMSSVVVSANGHTYGDDGNCTGCGTHEATSGLSYTYDSGTENYSLQNRHCNCHR